MSTPKVLTVTLEFEMGDRKIHAPRVKAAYEAAVSAAIDAAKNELLDGSVNTVRSRMTWDYRWAETSAQYTDVDVEWSDEDEEEPEE
ncbi:hypothetical protein [Streptomyces sp. C3-3]|uniref:hypothetical protein n=1 Tax=unclassified Streptomyces TaxID=2593676 RepID=UPI001B38BA3A|nr:hypothetical protein [Streptomyces sp. C3-3]MBQ1113754.1 hypothetical protein [Streptomyces sp. C3-3]